MSIISNTHQFNKLEKNSTALSGQRLVRLIAKANRDGKYASEHLNESLCVSIPRISDESIVNVIDRLIPHIVRMCEDAQDKIIREYRIESGRNEVMESVFDIDAVVGFLAADAAGDRVTKEYLAEWFATSYAGVATEWIKTISGGNMNDELIETKCSVLRDMFAGWASPKYSPNIPSLKAIIRFATYCVDSDCADSRMESIVNKAATMLDKKEKELSTDALGF